MTNEQWQIRRLKEYHRTCSNLQVVEKTFSCGITTIEWLRTEKNKMETALKRCGFFYRVMIEYKNDQWETFYMYRKKRIVRMSQVLQNLLKKGYRQEHLSAELTLIKFY